MSDKIGSFIIDVAGTELTPEDKDILTHPLVGGVILFTRNYENRQQLAALCTAIRKTRQSKLLIMVDQEGGRVQRFIPEFTRLPHLADLGRFYDQNPKEACKLAHEAAWLMATEILSVGIDLSLAPVLDIHNDNNKAVAGRSFHHHAKAIIQLATAYITGMHEAGMASTAKHFPGHGSVTVDSHVATPVDERTLDEIENTDMVPFAAMIKAGITCVMSSHISYPKIDKHPVGFSRIWLKDILRSKLDFNGIVFSDDLNMKGADVIANYPDRVEMARGAGCDFALLCNNRAGVTQVLDNLNYEQHLIDKGKWKFLSGNIGNQALNSIGAMRWQSATQRLEQLGTETTYGK